MKFDKNFASFLNDIIEDKIKSLFYSYMNKSGMMKGWTATVVEDNGDGTVNVTLAGDDTVLTKKNKSGAILEAGDEVELHSVSSLSNAYVSICKTKNITGTGTGGTDNFEELLNKPNLNTDNTGSLNISGSETMQNTINLHKISKTGDYNDLLNTPEMPVNTFDKTSDTTNNILEGSVNKFVTEAEKLLWNSKLGDEHTHSEENILDLDKYTRVEVDLIEGTLESAIDLKISIADIKDNLVTVSSDKPLSAYQGKLLKDYIDVLDTAVENINTLLVSDQLDLDTLQEIVNFIQQNKATLDTLAIDNIAGLQNALDLKSDITYVDTELATKVNIMSGKDLSEENYSLTEKNKLESIEDNANNYTHPLNHDPNIITQDTDNRFVTDGQISSWDNKSEEHTHPYEPSNANIQQHIVDTDNPHSTTKSQLGLSNVQNTSDADKEISTLAQTQLDLKSSITYVDTELSNKVDKVDGKELSDENYSLTEKTKLEGIQDSANNYTHPTTHSPDIIAQDAENRLVTDTQINTWDSKSDAHTHPYASDSHTHLDTYTKVEVDSKETALQNAINLKSAISDIKDDLISTDTDKPLSANQGKVLKGVVDTLDTAVTDINDLLETDEVTLSTLQQIVDYIKLTRSDLDNIDLSNVGGVGSSVIRENQVTLESELSSVPVDISNYDPTNDVLLVYINGTRAYESIQYTIDEVNSNIISTDGIWEIGTNFLFNAINSESLGIVENYVTLVSASDTVTIGIPEFHSSTHALMAYINGSRGFENINYTVSEDNLSIVSTESVWAAGTEFLFISADSVNSGDNYTHPETHPASMIDVDETNRFVSDTQISTWNTSIENINTLLTSDTDTLDTLQEIVDYVQLNKEDLDYLATGSNAKLAIRENIVTSVEETNAVEIGIDTYNPEIDALLVYINGTRAFENVQYTIDTLNSTIISTDGDWCSETTFLFNAINVVALGIKENYVTLVSDSNVVEVGIDGFDCSTNILMVYINGTRAFKDISYAIGEDDISIVSTDDDWIEGTEFLFITATASNSGNDAPVTSINGEIGDVVLNNSKLQNTLTGEWEVASYDTEYFSPEQHGTIVGGIYRRYMLISNGLRGQEVNIDIGITPNCLMGLGGFVKYSGTKTIPLPFTWRDTNYLVGVEINGSIINIVPSSSMDMDGGVIWIDYSK